MLFGVVLGGLVSWNPSLMILFVFLYLQMCNSFLTVTHILPWYALNIFKPVLPRIELDSQGTSAGFLAFSKARFWIRC